MPLVQAKFFLQANGNDPINCQVDSNTKIIAEVIIQSEYPVTEEVDMMEVSIADVSTGICVKKFRWERGTSWAGALIPGHTQTIDTPIFGPIPKGTYSILLGFIGKPISVSLGEGGINLKEVPC